MFNLLSFWPDLLCLLISLGRPEGETTKKTKEKIFTGQNPEAAS
jgi:hypothetical protein